MQATHAPYRLGLVVIARNEAGRIERLLGSAAPWVDHMLVLDTGSTDATPALAATCGAQVEHIPWSNDFSAARNAALDLSPADWHLVLDADEWLIDGGQALAALRHSTPDFVGALQFVDQFFDGQSRHETTWLSRVWPGALRFQGRIHEQVTHDLPVRRLAVQIGHDGYLPDSLKAKAGRNRILLQADLQDRPDDAYLWYQLGKDWSVYDDYAQAEIAFARADALDGAAHGWWMDLVVRRLFGFKKLKRHAEGLEFAQLQLARCSDFPDYFFALGDLLLDLAADQPEHASTLLPMMQDAWTRCLVIGERPDLSGAVVGRGSYLAAHNLALALELVGRGDEALVLRLRHPTP
jgi:glycosyltransferase involved in cell wall biosynthesis